MPRTDAIHRRLTTSHIFLVIFLLIGSTTAAVVAQDTAGATPTKKNCAAKSCKNQAPSSSPSASPSPSSTPTASPSATKSTESSPSPSQDATATAEPQGDSGGTAEPGGSNDTSGTADTSQVLPPPLDVFPNSTNVGTPADTTFAHEVNGDLHTDVDGQVIRATRVSGTLYIENDNVTVYDSRILQEVRVVGSDTKGFRIWSTTIGSEYGVRSGQAIGSRNFIARRIEIFGTFDGVKAQGNVDVRDSYIHDLYRTTDTSQSNGMTHNDCVQVQAGGGNVFEHNRIDCWSFGDGEVAGAHIGVSPFNGAGYTTSAFIISACCGDITGVAISNNRIRGATSNHIIVTSTGSIANVSVTNNEIGSDDRSWPKWHSTYMGANPVIDGNVVLAG